VAQQNSFSFASCSPEDGNIVLWFESSYTQWLNRIGSHSHPAHLKTKILRSESSSTQWPNKIGSHSHPAHLKKEILRSESSSTQWPNRIGSHSHPAHLEKEILRSESSSTQWPNRVALQNKFCFVSCSSEDRNNQIPKCNDFLNYSYPCNRPWRLIGL
jgi:hypothetical protein